MCASVSPLDLLRFWQRGQEFAIGHDLVERTEEVGGRIAVHEEYLEILDVASSEVEPDLLLRKPETHELAQEVIHEHRWVLVPLELDCSDACQTDTRRKIRLHPRTKLGEVLVDRIDLTSHRVVMLGE